MVRVHVPVAMVSQISQPAAMFCDRSAVGDVLAFVFRHVGAHAPNQRDLTQIEGSSVLCAGSVMGFKLVEMESV